jgi:hypothetical protein
VFVLAEEQILANNCSIKLVPITDGDVPDAAGFLHEHMNRRLSVSEWASALRPPWPVEAPNHGFMLVAGSTIVGVQVAFYSQRRIDGENCRFCNVAVWCVVDGYRHHSLRLLKALLAQQGYHFTDLSPSGNVLRLNAKLKFQPLDTATALVPNLPWPIWSGQPRISSDPELIESTLQGRDLEIYRDHSRAPAAYHLLIIGEDETCYIMFRRDRRKNLPLFASLLYVGNPSLFNRTARHVLRHLLFRYGILATLAEIRVVGNRPPLSLMLRSPRPKMYRSNRLRADQIDYLYSELTCVPW